MPTETQTKTLPNLDTRTPLAEHRVVGKSVQRVDAAAKVRGQAVYTADMHLPRALVGKVLFSDRPHARIRRIDVSRALALPGVRVALTGTDTPDILYGLYVRDKYILAKERVRGVGEPVAAVAAEDERTAEAALRLIEVDYEDLPALLDVEEALKPDAPALHPALKDYVCTYPYIRYGNVHLDTRVTQGEPDKAFAEADLVIEETYHTQPIHQASLEPHACSASFDPSGRVTVWTGTQQLSVCHFEVALSLGLPMSQVRVIPLWLGGGFGGKLKSQLEPVVALLAMKAGRPVRIVLSREEEIVSSHGRAPFTFRLKTGVKRDGTLTAREADIVVDAGGYVDHALGTAAHALTAAQGSYFIPNCRARARSVYTNNPDWGCMRGYGNSEINFAIEAQMDLIAHELGLDPAELRLKNLLQEGDQMLSTQAVHGVTVGETMRRALEEAGYWRKKGNLGPNRGIGVANLVKGAGLLSSAAMIKINEDGTASIITAITDIGSGTHTVLCQIAAEVLGLPVEAVHVACQDSDTAPTDTGSIASRTTFDAGNAVRAAAEDVKAQLLTVAATTLGCEAADLEYADGRAARRDDPAVGLNYKDIVGIATYVHHGPLMGHGAWIGTRKPPAEVGEGYPEDFYPTFAFGTHVAEVEVDPATGITTVISLHACHDAGRVLNPLGIEGQIQGGAVQGIGYGLFEELVVEDGAIQNANLVDFKIPTALDVPNVTVSFVEAPDPAGPFGAKGVGEHPILAPAPAIVNAIYDATGIHFTRLPVTPERLYFALKQREEERANDSAG